MVAEKTATVPPNPADLLERARAAGCEVTVLPQGRIDIRPKSKLPPDLLSEIVAHKFAVLHHFYLTRYTAWFWLDGEPKVRELLREARLAGASVSVHLPDGSETSDLSAVGAAGASVHSAPESLLPALQAAGFRRMTTPPHIVWANAWHDACSDLVESWRREHDLSTQLLVWLYTDACDAVSARGFEPWPEAERVYGGLGQSLERYGREGVVRPLLRRWLAAHNIRESLRGAGRYHEEQETDYRPLKRTPEGQAASDECLKWAWLALAAERLGGAELSGWVDPTEWGGLLEEVGYGRERETATA